MKVMAQACSEFGEPRPSRVGKLGLLARTARAQVSLDDAKDCGLTKASMLIRAFSGFMPDVVQN